MTRGTYGSASGGHQLSKPIAGGPRAHLEMLRDHIGGSILLNLLQESFYLRGIDQFSECTLDEIAGPTSLSCHSYALSRLSRSFAARKDALLAIMMLSNGKERELWKHNIGR